MLRVAVPNKGSLSDTASEMLYEAGYVGRRDPRALNVRDERNGVEFFYLRPRDIATYVGSGALDVGITGRDLLLDSHSTAVEVDELDFGASTFRFAGPIGRFDSLEQLKGVRVATSYAALVTDFLGREGITAEVVHLDGAVESTVRLGVADAVADVVETGSTLKKQGLEIFGPVILESHAVLVAHQYVLMDYDLPAQLLDAASKITPGLESPTVSQTRDSEWVAVRVMVPRVDTNHVMDALYELGARAILVSAIHA